MLIKSISIKSLIVCAVIGGLFTLGAPVTRASEPVTENTSVQVFKSVDEIPAEVLEKIPPEMLEEAKANPGKPIRKTTKTISSTSDVNVKMYNKNGEEEEIAPEILEQIKANPKNFNPEILGKGKPIKSYKTVSVVGADDLSDAELKEEFPELLADHEGRIMRSKEEHDAAIGEIRQKVTAPVLTVISQNGDHAVLEFDNKEGTTMDFDVVDINGNTVKTVTTQGDRFIVSGLASGTYFVNSKENLNTQAKIVISK